ncbi:chromosome segregation protein [Allocatelliglobosispora scoriae]|uniref:Chromosome partition protein Smc n=1 Tax=Allocatelliglobosispora scoriae TaxID=643052 RepID=A0A841BX05_9ACTN|nr:chromosome segregation protein SMC [Allocatelliglobosispora scoriae]MBB5872205.1 chromosome segregation protein [Allocatelliglobosispora scoriae]
MHLKSLTVKGFKSFASATTLKLEPGITCVVGPNGSGKSNVVDAISWVLGEQGAKALRGGKMEDVIFAGTSGRAPLGRAEVTLTIDNTDGALPIDYTEVSITRRMFRSGESEYEINGDRCRLVDIQELLSDSGIGREMHVIVGQGQLDAVLHAKPEDRRAFIEEAAGVLKHRKRKEKALRKLDAMQVNLNRLTDLTTELRRQLKPLGRQAEVARRAATIQADLRDARLRLLADDLFTLRTTLDKEVADEAALRDRRKEVEREFAQANRLLGELETAHAADAPALTEAQDIWYQLSTLQERFRSTAQLASERLRHLSTVQPEDEQRGRDPEQLIAESERVRAEEADLREALLADQERLAEAVMARQELEHELAAAERALVAAVKAIADRREGLAKLAGQVSAARERTSTAAEEIARLSAAHSDAAVRAAEAQLEVDMVSASSTEADRDNAALDEAFAEATSALDAANAIIKQLSDAERAAEKDGAGWKAREEALSLGLRRKDGAGALLAKADEVPGLLGSVASLITIDSGCEVALAAALGVLADAVAVTGIDEAAEAMRQLKISDAGRASLLVAGRGGGGYASQESSELPDGARWARDVVRCPEQLRPALDRALVDIVLVTDLNAATALVSKRPGLRAVTTDGDIVGVHAAAGGSSKAPSLVETQAQVEEARQRRTSAEAEVAKLRGEIAEARDVAATRKQAVDYAAQAKRQAEGERNAAARRLAELGAASRSAKGEADRLGQARDKAAANREQDLMRLEELEERLHLAEESPLDEDPSPAARDQLSALVPQARQNEMEVRLAVRTAEERVSSIAGRADSLLRQANAEKATRERAAARRAARERGALIAKAAEAGARFALESLGGTLTLAAQRRDEIATARSAREAELAECRANAKRHGGELDRLTTEVHRDEVARAEQRLRIEQLELKAAEEFSLDVETLLGEYGPLVLVPPNADAIALDPDAEGVQYDRATQEKRAGKAERDLSLLGKVNPLALEEFEAMEERYKFLSDQLEDLKATRKDLLTVVKDVDDRILQVFAEAFADTAREFEQVFKVLFPGGEGRLILTDPDDMLTTGIEVEARPPGKKIKRLSLLSGGERSLTAVAMLVAIFRARPSPFYIMDEVEAALDDVNLGRLITLFSQLREKSQLIIITHQKRTMEVADALYGVTMRAGVTEVISQRLVREDAAGEDDE